MSLVNKSKIKLSIIPLQSILPKEFKSRSQRGVCTPVLIAALLTIAKIWKKPTFLSIGKWIKKMR